MRSFGYACAATLGAFALAAPSHASPAEPDGWWYYTQTGAQGANEAGYRGQGVTIAVLDTPYNAAAPELQNANITSLPSPCRLPDGSVLPSTTTGIDAQHGTDMISLMVGDGSGTADSPGMIGVAPDATILHVAIASETGEEFYGKEIECLTEESAGTLAPISQVIVDAVDAGADFISISNSLAGGSEISGVAYALAHGVVVVAALPNESIIIDSSVASLSGVIGVERMDAAGNLIPANFDGSFTESSYITIVSPGDGILNRNTTSADWVTTYTVGDGGNSSATAITSAMLAVVKSKYPNATNNQIVQSLIHNAGFQRHEMERDDFWGYGPINLEFMLETDPTQYSDVNPLLKADAPPFPEDIAKYAAPSVDPIQTSDSTTSAPATDDTTTPAPDSSSSTAVADPPSTSSGLPTAAWVGIGAGVVLIIAVIAILATRSRRRPPAPPGTPSPSAYPPAPTEGPTP